MLNVVAFGSLPLGYQWRLNGTNLIGATGSSLVVSNIQSGQLGNYSVLVTNYLGFTLSADAVLSFAQSPAPSLGRPVSEESFAQVPTLGITFSGGNLVFSWSANSTDYELEAALELNGKWAKVTAPPQLIGGQFVVTINPTATARQFFRLHKP